MEGKGNLSLHYATAAWDKKGARTKNERLGYTPQLIAPALRSPNKSVPAMRCDVKIPSAKVDLSFD